MNGYLFFTLTNLIPLFEIQSPCFRLHLLLGTILELPEAENNPTPGRILWHRWGISKKFVYRLLKLSA